MDEVPKRERGEPFWALTNSCKSKTRCFKGPSQKGAEQGGQVLARFNFALQQLAVNGQTMAGVGVNATIGPFCHNCPNQLGETHVVAKPSEAIICATFC